MLSRKHYTLFIGCDNQVTQFRKEPEMAIATLPVGAVVVNFGIRAEVIGFLSDGSPIVRSLDRGDKWVVDPAKCQIVTGYEAVTPHPTALVQMVGA
jgi:hypothetical protein